MTSSRDRRQKLENFHSQCFLVDFMDKFAAMKGGVGLKGSPLACTWAPHHVAEVLKPGHPSALMFLNKLTDPKAQNLISNFPTALLERMQPTIRLYKVKYKSAKDVRGTFIPLPIGKINLGKEPVNHPGYITGFEGNILARAVGNLAVNLEEFSFDYEGVNPAEVDYYIRARLKLFCPSVDAFFQDHNGASFADLIKRPSSHGYIPGNPNKVDSHRDFSESFFRIFVDLSYPRPPGFIIEELKKSYPEINDIFDALEASRMSFFLNIIKHEVEIISDVPSQPFKVAIEYVASVESSMYSPNANILEPSPANREKLKDFERSEEGDLALAEVSVQEDLLVEAGGLETILTMDDPTLNELMSVNYNSIVNRPRPLSAAKQVAQLPPLLPATQVGAARIGSQIYNKTHYNTPLQMIESSKKAWVQQDLQDQWSRENFLLVSDYHEARQNLVSKLSTFGLVPDQLKIDAYTRLLNLLYGAESDDPKDIRVYSLQFTTKKFLEWIEKRETRGQIGKQEDLDKLKRKAQKKGNEGKAARKAIKKLRADAQAAMKAFNVNFWEKNVAKKHKTSRLSRAMADAKKEENTRQARKSGAAPGNSPGPRVVTPPSTTETYTVEWFYLGDLIDAALTIVKQNEEGLRYRIGVFNDGYGWTQQKTRGNFHVIFGSCEYISALTGGAKQVSLARLPISVRLFNEFWQKRVVNQKERYPFQQFLRNVLTDLVNNVFTNQCAVEGEAFNKVRGSYDHVTLFRESPQKIFFTDPSRHAGVGLGPADECWKAILTTNPLKEAEHLGMSRITEASRTMEEKLTPVHLQKHGVRDVILIYARTNTLGARKGDKIEDNKSGILHLDLGSTGTAIKDVSFSKADVPLYLETKGERAGLMSNPLELSEPYNVSFTTIGTNVFKPGRHFFLTLPHFGLPEYNTRSAARVLGLGGYFMVIKVGNTLTTSGARIDWYSNVEAVWVNFAGSAKAKGQEIPPTAIEAESPAPAGEDVRLRDMIRWSQSEADRIRERDENRRLFDLHIEAQEKAAREKKARRLRRQNWIKAGDILK